jgi:hypothetical protein
LLFQQLLLDPIWVNRSVDSHAVLKPTNKRSSHEDQDEGTCWSRLRWWTDCHRWRNLIQQEEIDMKVKTKVKAGPRNCGDVYI